MAIFGERQENIVELHCPYCSETIKVIGCRTCEFRHRNFENYEEAKECWDCDMLHKNYKKGD